MVILYAMNQLVTCSNSVFTVLAIKFGPKVGIITVERVLSSAKRMNNVKILQCH